jgi:hypothetical protein
MASARQARAWSTPARKSPLRVVTEIPPAAVGAGQATDARLLAPDSVPALRQMMISEFCEWLRSRTSRHGRPFQHETVSAYRDAAVALDAWMTRSGLEADFTGRLCLTRRRQPRCPALARILRARTDIRRRLRA